MHWRVAAYRFLHVMPRGRVLPRKFNPGRSGVDKRLVRKFPRRRVVARVSGPGHALLDDETVRRKAARKSVLPKFTLTLFFCISLRRYPLKFDVGGCDKP
jgi:hypothetical protein